MNPIFKTCAENWGSKQPRFVVEELELPSRAYDAWLYSRRKRELGQRRETKFEMETEEGKEKLYFIVSSGI